MSQDIGDTMSQVIGDTRRARCSAMPQSRRRPAWSSPPCSSTTRLPPRSPPGTACTAPGSTSSRPGTRPRARRLSNPGRDAPKPHRTRPHAEVVDLIVRLRKELADAGLDAGAETIGWHLTHHHGHRLSRVDHQPRPGPAGTVIPEPKKRPKSSYLRFEAAMPNETWQSDFTHYRLTHPTATRRRRGDHRLARRLHPLRPARHRTPRVTAPIVLTTFREALTRHGYPASTLTDNGMVYTVRLAGHGRQGGRNAFEAELRRSPHRPEELPPSHPTTCGKAERFQQTMKKRLRAQPVQPTTIAELQTLLDTFVDEYNHRRPHRSLPHRATPATAYTALPKATPDRDRSPETHDRIRHDIVSNAGSVTLRIAGQLHHIGIGRTYARTRVILLVQDLHVRVVDATTGSASCGNRSSTPARTTNPRPQNDEHPNLLPQVREFRDVSETSHFVAGAVSWFRTSATDVSRHRRHDVAGHRRQPRARLGRCSVHVEGPPGHHRPVRRPPDPGRGRRPVRRAPRLGLQAQGPLRGRGRGRVRAPLPTTRRPPRRDPEAEVGRPDRAAAQAADRGRPGRRRRDHRLAPDPPPPVTACPGPRSAGS